MEFMGVCMRAQIKPSLYTYLLECGKQSGWEGIVLGVLPDKWAVDLSLLLFFASIYELYLSSKRKLAGTVGVISTHISR